jgi:hypothetical protein
VVTGSRARRVKGTRRGSRGAGASVGGAVEPDARDGVHRRAGPARGARGRGAPVRRGGPEMTKAPAARWRRGLSVTGRRLFGARRDHVARPVVVLSRVLAVTYRLLACRRTRVRRALSPIRRASVGGIGPRGPSIACGDHRHGARRGQPRGGRLGIRHRHSNHNSMPKRLNNLFQHVCIRDREQRLLRTFTIH